MNKEPIGLYIFRYILGFGLFAFMCMLYWSSTLVEGNLQALRSDISQLKNDLFALRLEFEKTRNDLLQTLLNEQGQERSVREATPPDAKANASDPEMKKGIPLKNASASLLHQDPFYTVTLPKLLGKGFVPHGTQHLAAVGKPANLHPFANWANVVGWNSLCTAAVVILQFGKYETFAPNMALRIEERINPTTNASEFWVFLQDNVFWQPLKQEFFSAGTYLAPQFSRKTRSQLKILSSITMLWRTLMCNFRALWRSVPFTAASRRSKSLIN